MNMLMNKTDKPAVNQQGFASIVIALILILVLALLTVGFAALARREQQNALDKQLATQANYAAETGANDLTHLIRQAIAKSGDPTYHPSLTDLAAVDPTRCIENQSVPNLPSDSLDSTADIRYTCALLDLHPPSLQKDPLDANTAWNFSFSTDEASSAPPAPLDKLTVSWQSTGGLGPRTTTGFAPRTGANKWTSMAVLQVSITPLLPLNRGALLSNTYTTFLYPMNGGGTADYSPNGSIAQAPVVNATGCGAGAACSVTIDNLSHFGAVAGEGYLMTIYAYYDNSNVVISNARDTNGVQLNFINGQARIDVTGKDKDVLKRIQVHIPISGIVNTLPSYGLQAQDICKRLDTQPGGTTYESAGAGATPSTTFDTFDPCSFNNDIPLN